MASKQIAAATLKESTSHRVPGKLTITEYMFKVPVDYTKPDAHPPLTLFARSATRFENPVDPPSDTQPKQPPWLLYLQGGPGMPCKSPQSYSFTSTLVEKGYALLFLDQRGTGLSTTVTTETLRKIGNAEKQADYLTHFRADSIVRDAEAIREVLTKDYPAEKKKWSIIGQSFGGFCSVHYLSTYPNSLREVYTCGGLAPLVNKPDEVYKRLFKKVAQRNEAYYAKYAEDDDRVKKIIRYIQGQESIKLPDGGFLTSLRLRQLGWYFGFHGGVDDVHDIIYRLGSDLEQFGFFTRPTLATFSAVIPFDTMPLYALIHEMCYLQGEASRWAADRVIVEYPEFANREPDVESTKPIYFTGEMVLKKQFEDYDELHDLLPVAEILANKTDWPRLYDTEQLKKNTVPVFSATYVDDMYVDFDFACETARTINGCRNFVTNAMYHDALGSKSDDLVKQLIAMRDDVMD